MAGRTKALGGIVVGLGDQLIGAGLARGAFERGKRIAFGDGKRIMWDQHSREMFASNPNIAEPGNERAADLEWVPFYKGNRLYNRQAPGRWVWNMDFRATPGEMFFSHQEQAEGRRYGAGFVLIEPYVAPWKASSVNKDWGRANYQAVAERLLQAGHTVLQLRYPQGGPALMGTKMVTSRSFRDALSIMQNAALYIGPEGGLHHGAAAVGVPGVVLFGGFIPPAVTGYTSHTNLTGNSTEACGSLRPCPHCRAAMAAISVDQVTEAALNRLRMAA
jgi:ADP-heptose:LPS heptosyltransferase